MIDERLRWLKERKERDRVKTKNNYKERKNLVERERSVNNEIFNLKKKKFINFLKIIN